MKETTNKNQSMPWVHHYVKFFVLSFFVVFLPILISFAYILLKILSEGYSFPFGFLLKNYLSLDFSKILFWLAFVFLIFGGLVFFVQIFSYFSFQVYNIQIRNFYRLPTNKRVFYKMKLPQNYHYDSRNICGLIKEFYLSFISTNITWSTVLSTGKYHHTASFDYIVENGEVNCYVSFPFTKQAVATEAFKKFFPEIELTLVKDPFGEMPSQWSEDDSGYKYDNMAGCVISHSMSEMYGTIEPKFSAKKNTNITDFLTYLAAALPNDKIVLQYVFTFDPLIDTSVYDEKYDKLAQKLVEDYSPSNGKKKSDSDAFGHLVSKHQINRMNQLNDRLKEYQQSLIRTGIKVAGFCKDADYSRTERAIDKAIKAYFQENTTFASDNQLEKAYLTATNQTYFNHHKVYKDIDDRAWFMHKRMVYLPTILEPYFASLYNQFYYPNENRWRRRNLYIALKRRLGYKPLSDGMCLIDYKEIDRFFQIPTFKSDATNSLTVKSSKGIV
jgi:hypothetical protein